MWVNKSAIRPVPAYARIGSGVLEIVRGSLLSDPDNAQDELDAAFADFDEHQPALAAHVGEVLSRPLGDAALALGYFLTLSIWLMFKRAHGRALKQVTLDELRGTMELLAFDEDLRENHPEEPLDTDDVVAMQQPDLIGFIQEHVEATLDVQGEDVDPEHLQTIYRAAVIELLALSYAVQPPAGYPVSKSEILA